MKRIICLASIIFISCFSIAAMPQDIAAAKKMMHKQFMSVCGDDRFLKCVGIDKNKCNSSTEKTLSSCDHLFPKDMDSMDEGMTAFGECFSKKIIKNAGISAEKLDTCEPTTNQPPMNMEQGMAMMSHAMQQHAQFIGTDRVTLPLYKNATVISHLRSGDMSRMYEDVENLSALKMESPDSVGDIASFYRGKLKGFKEYKILGGIIFMKNGPKDFDIMRDMKRYVSTPHVEIMPVEGATSASQGPKSEIQISYKE